MLHPILDLSSLNATLTFSGLFILAFGFISLKIKQHWYLGEALPAFVIGVILGPFCANFINIRNWSDQDEEGEIAYGLTRLVIGIQMVKVGYELPKRYLRQRLMELTICLLPLMTLQWLATSACILLMVPRLSFLSALIIGSCVICIDPILSQAIAKGPFADKYVRRHLREFISAEAGGNDGFGFPFLLLSVAILRYADVDPDSPDLRRRDWIGETNTGRFGGDIKQALAHWAVEGVLYMIILGSGYGLLVGFLSRKGINLASRRRWVDKECFCLFPVAIGLFLVGTCGCFGTDETLACFIAGCSLNWDGLYHSELEARHDSFNLAIETVLNFGTFIFIGLSMPWDQMNMPHATGISIPRLITLGILILLFRRIPAVMLGYRFMPKVCRVGAISYVEYARRLLPDPGQSDAEINHLTAAMVPVVYWLVFFSIVVHGLSIPALNGVYRWFQVPIIRDHPVEVLLLSENEPLPNNSTVDRPGHFVINNRFSCLSDRPELPDLSEEMSLEAQDFGSAEQSTKRSSRQVENIYTA
ncbi:Cation/H+ exchanger [Penicillium chermesinum]|uniref:Cation/H+ exchanger n=1 Tax=Penicillium chermesinum TaxID=63820 RepID=A0A9W9TY05_9EURO|nr:Cation/H+ exchanger [Penicillium chermesinum]KAJ5248613.1 Cation/H+ exchanger [Penicillium chermesinum]